MTWYSSVTQFPQLTGARSWLLALALLTAPAQAAQPDAQLDKAKEALPSGDSSQFRNRMLNWGADQTAPMAVTARPTTRGTSQLLRISSPFGWRSDPIKGIRRRHDGIDLPGRLGDGVFATGSGHVTVAGWAGGYGNLVEIGHPGGVRTRYGHLSEIMVSPGERVKQGQRIGRVGSTGRSTGPHLHYEVRSQGLPADPLAFIGQTAPAYDATWASEKLIEPHWTGWREQNALLLPEASIR